MPVCGFVCVCVGDIDINFQLLSILFFEKGLLLKLEHNDRLFFGGGGSARELNSGPWFYPECIKPLSHPPAF